MASQFGPEIDPKSPEYQWVSSIIKSVEKRTGATTRWNGKLYEEPDPRYLGTAHHDGSMTVSKKNVLDPAKQAYTAGRPLTKDESAAARDSAATVAHEAVHLSGRPGDQNVPGAHPVYNDSWRALEEGMAESWTHRQVDNVIYDINMDKVAPDAIGAPMPDAYPGFTPAANEMIDGLHKESGRPRDEVANTLIRTDATQRWNTAADMMIDSKLTGLMPESHRDAVRAQIAAPAFAEFDKLPAIQDDPNRTAAEKSAKAQTIGRTAMTGMAGETQRIEQHYQSENARIAAQQAAAQQAAAQQTAGQQTGSGQQTGPIQQGPTQQGPTQGQQPRQTTGQYADQATAAHQTQQPAAQAPAADQATTGQTPATQQKATGQAPAASAGEQSTDPEIAKLQSMLGGQAPAQASQAAGDDGSRQQTGGQTPGRQALAAREHTTSGARSRD